jgi:DNA-binding transcriptional MerR regulator
MKPVLIGEFAAMSERSFTIHETCAAVGVTAVSVHQWIQREHFVPLHEPQAGLRRDYTLRDIVHLAAIAELGKAGVPPVRAAKILGTSPLDTAGRQTVVARRSHAEIRLDLASIADRIRTALT